MKLKSVLEFWFRTEKAQKFHSGLKFIGTQLIRFDLTGQRE